MTSGRACATCGFRLGEPIAQFEASELCFVSDRRFPGRCVLTLREHATELFEASASARQAFMEDMSRAAWAIKTAVDSFKMNYEILGNADPHVHCHLVPRQSDEPNPGAPAWLHPEPQAELDEASARQIKDRIRELLNTGDKG
ncbi:HIT family protein [uncultured Marinobacter sp.]|uniref:HIT family protein n=1 Tax=uncultured Marinobacter sp. TaxID=187379 RepID=UPI0030DA35F1|tara:strand:- start:6622 stop:7050 length:429 start_codon:yes stop_codon:yes gene_type:complete